MFRVWNIRECHIAVVQTCRNRAGLRIKMVENPAFRSINRVISEVGSDAYQMLHVNPHIKSRKSTHITSQSTPNGPTAKDTPIKASLKNHTTAHAEYLKDPTHQSNTIKKTQQPPPSHSASVSTPSTTPSPPPPSPPSSSPPARDDTVSALCSRSCRTRCRGLW